MKNIIPLFVISAIFFGNCSRVKDDIPKLTLNDKAYIKIIAENSFDSLIIRTNYSSYFPLQPCLIHQMIIKEKGDYYASYRVTKPELVMITMQDTFFTYMTPRDTLVIKVGSDKHSTKKSLVYHKIDDPIYTYLQKEFNNFGSYYFRSPIVEKSFNTTPTSLKELEKAISEIDSAQKDRLAFLEKNMDGLPKWFINTQRSDYVYLSANIKYLLNYYLRNRDLMGEFPFLDVKIYNPEAKFSSSYYRFISEYFLITYSNKSNEFRGPLRMINLYNKASREINYNLKGEILRNFNIYLLASLYKASDSEKEIDSVDKFIQSRDFGLNNLEKAFVNQEKSDIQKSIEKQYSLKPGDKAPSFYLEDTSGNLHKLSEYLGKVVYLHFWATWCGPCIKELPTVNQLIDKINDKPIIIINICLDDKPNEWKQIIKNEKLQGMNLICKRNIGDFLQNAYSFNKIPHYVLLDDKGLIISNSSKRPHDIYDELIQLIRKN